jgi:hypothetical protein
VFHDDCAFGEMNIKAKSLMRLFAFKVRRLLNPGFHAAVFGPAGSGLVVGNGVCGTMSFRVDPGFGDTFTDKVCLGRGGALL